MNGVKALIVGFAFFIFLIFLMVLCGWKNCPCSPKIDPNDSNESLLKDYNFESSKSQIKKNIQNNDINKKDKQQSSKIFDKANDDKENDSENQINTYANPS